MGARCDGLSNDCDGSLSVGHAMRPSAREPLLSGLCVGIHTPALWPFCLSTHCGVCSKNKKRNKIVKPYRSFQSQGHVIFFFF